ncbi:hypothetical protein EC843_12011 [Buttiauxella sp. JUb87]|nr:hypothetical protein [Buttiauxella sp. JUb87]TDN47042.1 hypothetical protein EC843_12011 [Buttiauxella sp. JUb87]
MKKQPQGLFLAVFLFPLRTPLPTALSPDSVDNFFPFLEQYRSPQC